MAMEQRNHVSPRNAPRRTRSLRENVTAIHRPAFKAKTPIRPTDLISQAPLAGFDTETDGLYIERGARIREFALVDQGGLRLGWSGLGDANATLTSELLGRLMNSFEGTILVGHNLSFDLKFLAAEADRLGQFCPPLYCIDTLGLSRKYLANMLDNFELARVARHLQLALPDALHRAEPDARLSLSVFESLSERFALKTLADAKMRRFAL